MKNEVAAKLKAMISETVTEMAGEKYTAIMEENEAKGKELRESVDAQIKARVEEFVARQEQNEKAKGVGHGIAQVARALAGGRGDVEKAHAFAEANGFRADVVKALATSPGADGGYIVPPGFSSDLIELLYNRVAVRELGAVSVPMPSGNITIPKVTGGATAAYVGENQGQNSQQQTLGVISLSWKKLRATVPMSNDLIRFSNPRVDDMVRNDLVNAFAIAEDAAFLRGTGTGQAPKGIKSFIPAAQSVDVTDPTGADAQDTINDLLKLGQFLEESNIGFISPGWIFSPRTKRYLMGLRDVGNQLLFMDEMRRGTLFGFPFVSTNQVPNNLAGGGGTASEIIFGDFADALIGEADSLLLDVSTEASYKDESGSLVSAFDLDQTVIRGISRHDFAVRREESFAELTDVRWGA